MDPAGLLNIALTQAAADMEDPRQHLAWALGSFPHPNKQMGEVALSPPVPADLSERLNAFGFRHHPELQTKWVVPGDHPEAGFLNVPKIVDRTEYEAYQAARAHPNAVAEKWGATAEAVLGKIDPKLLHRINNMTADQKVEELPKASERIAQLQAEIRKNPEGPKEAP